MAQVVSVGTHDILFCEVQALVRNDETHGLAWFDRGYHHLLRQDAR
ncbi:flavin reductase (DIM6/NTAB) family NADH-FMN oxidoreductase RutF [Kluyvera sp. 1366]